ncbi:MAG: panthothenate synthetase [Acidobacteriaceae bacterium]
MRILMRVTLPHDTFNAAVKDGSAGQKIKRILDEVKPEAVYFTEFNGHRTAMLIVDMTDSSQIPSFCEPWFLQFHADCESHLAMTPADLAKGGLDALGKKWA